MDSFEVTGLTFSSIVDSFVFGGANLFWTLGFVLHCFGGMIYVAT